MLYQVTIDMLPAIAEPVKTDWAQYFVPFMTHLSK